MNRTHYGAKASLRAQDAIIPIIHSDCEIFSMFLDESVFWEEEILWGGKRLQVVKDLKGGSKAMDRKKMIITMCVFLLIAFSPAVLMADILEDVIKRGVVKVGELPDEAF